MTELQGSKDSLRHFNIFAGYCKEKGIPMNKVNGDIIEHYLASCAEGYPNNKPKKETTLRTIRYALNRTIKTNPQLFIGSKK
jgi:hypothetical protein